MSNQQNGPSAHAPHDASKRSGEWFRFAIGVSLIFIGSIFVALMLRSYLRANDMRKWPEVECVILSSIIAERRNDPASPVEYRHEVSYGYSWHGKAYTSSTFSLRGTKWSSHFEKAVESRDRFPAGSNHSCRINPSNPEQAVLKTDSLAPLYSIWFPGLFVIGGIGICTRSVIAMKHR